jgi:RHS repeat-associated protein
MNSRTINSGSPASFAYQGNEMSSASGSENFTLGYDENGNLTSNEAQATSYEYNWDNKLRSAEIEGNSIEIKYDPAGNRVAKNSTINGNRKYIVDVVGDLPVILLELEPLSSSQFAIKKAYIYANSEILAEHDGDVSADKYYYLHDRLGSVRQVINSAGYVVKMFTFNPFGEKLEEQGTFYTPWQFTGQFLDSETGMYYLRARQYSPYLSRFTGRDLIMGKFEEPMTLHKYFYCQNDPINMFDLNGKWGAPVHSQIIKEAFSGQLGDYSTGLIKNSLDEVRRGSEWVDSLLNGNQAGKNAYMHAMTDAKTGQTREEAEKQMWWFVTQHYFAYKEKQSRPQKFGETPAEFELGAAMHPIMDMTCPTHNWQPWKPIEFYKHDDPEIDKATMNKTVKRMRDTKRDLDAMYEWGKIAEMAGW